MGGGVTGVKREGRRIFGREARVSLIKHARVPAAPYAAAGAKFHAARFAPWEEVHFVVVTRAACRTEAAPPPVPMLSSLPPQGPSSRRASVSIISPTCSRLSTSGAFWRLNSYSAGCEKWFSL